MLQKREGPIESKQVRVGEGYQAIIPNYTNQIPPPKESSSSTQSSSLPRNSLPLWNPDFISEDKLNELLDGLPTKFYPQVGDVQIPKFYNLRDERGRKFSSFFKK